MGTESRNGAREPTVIDLFSGCGGGSLGFAAAGFRPVAAVESDPVAASSYEANAGIKPIVRDIRKVTGKELLAAAGLRHGQCMLLFGCPPCQSFTVLRRGVAATGRDRRRNLLVREYLRLVREVWPRHIAFENVPGMALGRGRRRFLELVAGLKELGYTVEHGIIDAADHGVPQRRERLLVVGSRVGTPQAPEPSHGSGGRNGRRPHRTVRDAIGHLAPLAAGESDRKDPYYKARVHRPLTLRRLRAIPEGGGRDDLPPRLKLRCHKNHNGHYDVYGRMWWDRPAPTLTSGCTNASRGRFTHPKQDRALTLREAMILQTFPRRTVLKGTTDEMAGQVGNAIPPLLARRIGACVLAVEPRAPGKRHAKATRRRSLNAPPGYSSGARALRRSRPRQGA